VVACTTPSKPSQILARTVTQMQTTSMLCVMCHSTHYAWMHVYGRTCAHVGGGDGRLGRGGLLRILGIKETQTQTTSTTSLKAEKRPPMLLPLSLDAARMARVVRIFTRLGQHPPGRPSRRGCFYYYYYPRYMHLR
jgi:hypothetical protein